MNREIKFRFWNQSLGGWQTEYSGLSCDGEFLTKMTHNTYVINPAVDLVAMQYTGLQDDDGRKIFEGDVLCSYPFVVTYDRGSYHASQAGPTLPDFLAAKSRRAERVMVIGNIYENPELLKEAQS